MREIDVEKWRGFTARAAVLIAHCSVSVIQLIFSSWTQGLEVGWCKDPDRGLPAPDKVLFLDISVEDAMKVCVCVCGCVCLCLCFVEL